MKCCKTPLLRLCLFLLLAVPAYCQRGSLGVDLGETSDKFGGLPSVTDPVFDVDGHYTFLEGNRKQGSPSVAAGFEVRLPAETLNHAREYAVFGGPAFHIHDVTIGFNIQYHKINLPAASVDNQYLNRDSLKLIELPLILKYNFGPGKRGFLEAQGAPEFTPHYKRSSSSLVALPNPNFDHGYFVRGTVGYTFGHWYAKATYETRYFKFLANPGNPSNLYNWKSNMITGGVGVAF